LDPTAGLDLPEWKKNFLLLPGFKLRTVEPAGFNKTFGIIDTGIPQRCCIRGNSQSSAKGVLV